MSRSYRKTPIYGNTKSDSEKEDKRIANRRYRRNTKQLIQAGHDTLPQIRELSDVWDFAKDGRRWYGFDKYPEYLRK